MNTKTVGYRLKSLREEYSISQLKLAKNLNIANSTLSQYESDKRIPSDDIKKKIANYFNVSLDYLMGKSDVKTHNNPNNIILSEQAEKDIAIALNSIRTQLNTHQAGEESDKLLYNGNPLSDESITQILMALEIGMRTVEAKNAVKNK